MNINPEIISIPKEYPRSVLVNISTSTDVSNTGYYFEVRERYGALGISLVGFRGEYNLYRSPRILVYPLGSWNKIEVWAAGGLLCPLSRLIGEQKLISPQYYQATGNGQVASLDAPISRLIIVNSSLSLSSSSDRICVKIECFERQVAARIMRTNGPWWPPDDVPEIHVGESPDYSLLVTAGTTQDKRFILASRP